ncbi:pentapeptide repeat-containing protein [Pseudobacteroides cellulosolvens]|uniref:Pentapeptide repeat protein n=1 Tax=Pseudobacteroides cellulosolvens ATCC 35603 = DSM 2933 TaxID=398512 RepID=A0A0L6JM38_9FIRM|nr:pentapeptide repeat-containing protein [Pseudobacteroides cellulosolvens]KNY26818.1 hypothetical protein Bccel_2083 [Pseudobacteroides cellulosolvens ATCC 35603 = DSM 2933]
MKKSEALQHFYDNYIFKIRDKKLNELKLYFETNKDTLAKEMTEAFRRICIKVKKLQLDSIKDKIAHIEFSLLRIRILEKRYSYLIDAYSGLYYLDKIECTSEYDVTWAFKYLEEFLEELEQTRKLYMNKILRPDLERIMLNEISHYNEYIVKLARYALPESVKIAEYNDLDRKQVVNIYVGDYRTSNAIVYREDNRIKNSGDIKSWLEGKYEDGYESEILKELDLSYGDYESINLSNCNFSGSNLSASNLKNSLLVGAIFNNTNLEGAKFENANLSYSDMRGAILKNVDFTRSNLKEAIFLRNDIQSLTLDDEQKKNIILV